MLGYLSAAACWQWLAYPGWALTPSVPSHCLQGLGMLGMGAFGAHPGLLGAHHPYGDMGLPGMGHMGMPGKPPPAPCSAAAAIAVCWSLLLHVCALSCPAADSTVPSFPSCSSFPPCLQALPTLAP